ncbi:MAG: HD domain-containing protein, partial [Actinomycetota bacterium]
MEISNEGSPSPEPTIEDLLAPVLAEFSARRSGEDPSMIVMAGKVAAESHDGQLRRSGEPYITHPIAVSEIAASLGLDATTIAAALLHDAVEDTRLTLEDITSQ